VIIHLSQAFNSHIAIKATSEHGIVYQNLNSFLSLLQTQLGLFNDAPYPTQRIIQYLKCLQVKDNKNRFYHQSMQVDELAVAKKLLSWRDELYLSGWDGTLSKEASKRLKDLAEVEKLAIKEVSPNEGQQLESIIQRLKSYHTQIKQIQLYDERHLLPQQWQRVLEHLEKQDISIIAPVKRNCCGKSETDLARLQNALANNMHIKLKGDGSVLVIKSQSKTNSAQLIAQYLTTKNQIENTFILAEREQKLLEQQLTKYDLPNPGFHQNSPSRSILQLLPLSMQLVWEPMDLNKVLSFLQHPINFIPKFAREILADTIASYPGIGGQHWNDAINEIKKLSTKNFKD